MQQRGKRAPTTIVLLLETMLWNPLLAAATVGIQEWNRKYFLCGPCRGVILETTVATQSIESQSVKRRLGGWCEMAASPAVSQFIVSLWSEH
jgi:hypothetical protein